MPSFGGFYDLVAGQDTVIDVGQGGLSGVLLGNESGLSLIVTMGGNNSRSLYPGWVDFFEVPAHQFSGVITIVNHAKLSNISTWPSSFIQVDKIGIGEQVRGTYPAPLVRSANIGNAVNTVGGIATGIQNDGNPASTSIIEATVLSDPSSAVKLSNDAVFVLGDGSHPGSLTTAGPASIAGTVSIHNSGVETVFTELNGADYRFESPSGVEVGRIENNGSIKAGGGAGKFIGAGLTLPVGSISRISKFSASVSGSPTFFNHNLGVVPDFVVCVPDGAANGTFTCIVDYGTMNGGQCKLTGSSSFIAQCLAIKL